MNITLFGKRVNNTLYGKRCKFRILRGGAHAGLSRWVLSPYMQSKYPYKTDTQRRGDSGTMGWDDVAKAKEGLGPPEAGRHIEQNHL